MKYLYKGMGIPGWGDISGSVLLGWHEKVRKENIHFVDHDSGSWRDMEKKMLTTTSLIPPFFFFWQLTEVAGVGCIVRTMTDRRIV